MLAGSMPLVLLLLSLFFCDINLHPPHLPVQTNPNSPNALLPLPISISNSRESRFFFSLSLFMFCYDTILLWKKPVLKKRVHNLRYNLDYFVNRVSEERSSNKLALKANERASETGRERTWDVVA
jgi:hypothetical protein